MFLAGDEFGSTQYGNNNRYCQDNEISWLNWDLLSKNHDLFEFFRFMIAFRFKHSDHSARSCRTPSAVCTRSHTHNINAADVTIPRDARTLSVSFAGYDAEKGEDDIIYLSVKTHREDVEISLPGPDTRRRMVSLCQHVRRPIWPLLLPGGAGGTD